MIVEKHFYLSKYIYSNNYSYNVYTHNTNNKKSINMHLKHLHTVSHLQYLSIVCVTRVSQYTILLIPLVFQRILHSLNKHHVFSLPQRNSVFLFSSILLTIQHQPADAYYFFAESFEVLVPKKKSYLYKKNA